MVSFFGDKHENKHLLILIFVLVESIEIRSVNSDMKIIILKMPIQRYSLLDTGKSDDIFKLVNRWRQFELFLWKMRTTLCDGDA